MCVLACVQDNLLDFVKIWEELDPYGTSYIAVQQLTALISKVRHAS